MAAALLLGAASLAAPLAAQAPARAAAFSPAGRYALKLVAGRDTVPFIVVADSAGRWGGTFIGYTGRTRPLVAVVPRDGEAALVIQWAEQNNFATALLRVAPDDAVRGTAADPDHLARLDLALLGTCTRAAHRPPVARRCRHLGRRPNGDQLAG